MQARPFRKNWDSMRSVLGLTLILVTAGCHSCGSRGFPSCGPTVCVEHHCYCRKLDDLHTGLAARKCALLALSGDECCDYRRGFTQAFVDVAHGKTGTAPPVPPQRYWSVCFRSSCGQGRASDWYSGYRDGAAIAAGQCGEVCRTVPNSGTGYHYGPTHQQGTGTGGWAEGGQEWNAVSACGCQR